MLMSIWKSSLFSNIISLSF